MRTFAIGLATLLVVTSIVSAQEEQLNQASFRPCRVYPNCPPGTYPPYDPSTPVPDPMREPGDRFAGAPEAGTQPAAMFNPNMFGDLIGIASSRNIVIGQSTTFTPNGNITVPIQQTVRGLPVVGRYNGFKITDNDNPRPVDRIFFNYNGYRDVGAMAGIPNMQMHQELLGFERTFLQGDASWGLRLPFIQINGFSQADAHVIGDLSIHLKFAWLNNRETGNVISTGFILTTPTGGGETILSDGTFAPHSILFQPWGGWIYNMDRAYVMGFHSVVIPSDTRDPAILFNSVSAGYWLFRSDADRFLRGFVPVVEMHVNTPLNHRSNNDLIFFKDQVNVTGGGYFMFPRMTIGAAVGVPLAGPRPYELEALGSLNFRF
jgi:hypothetical protein